MPMNRISGARYNRIEDRLTKAAFERMQWVEEQILGVGGVPGKGLVHLLDRPPRRLALGEDVPDNVCHLSGGHCFPAVTARASLARREASR